MNLSAAVMLVQPGIRPVRVEYDPENKANNNPIKQFKTLDETLKKDDLVIVPTSTRHGFTIAKVTEIDFAVDFNDPSPWGWIGGKFDKAQFDTILETEDKLKHKVAKVQENKMKAELVAAMGLADVDFSDMDLRKLGAPAAAEPVQLSPPPPPGSTE